MQTRSWATAEELTAALAGELANEAARATAQPRAIMLAGGTTPLAAYAHLTAHPPRVDGHLHLLFSDDRHVPPDSPHSNYGQIRPMLAAWQMPQERVLRVLGERPIDEATSTYDQALGRFLGQGGAIPLGVLGLGTDGHTASLFTPAQVTQGQSVWALSVARPDGLNGVTVSPRLLQRVGRIIVITTGVGKRATAERLVKQPNTLTAGLALAGHPRVELWTDQAAAPGS